jgi:hypothetical protein
MEVFEMKRLACIGTVMALIIIFFACSTTYLASSKEIFDGKRFLRNGQYDLARKEFLKAAETYKAAEAYAWVAVASYKLRDLPTAEQYIMLADSVPQKGWNDLRIAGYKALILLAEGKRSDGLAALQTYTDMYRYMYPVKSITEVEEMWKSGNVDLPRVEKVIDDQVDRREEEIKQFQETGTGYYDKPRTLRSE